MTYFYLVFGIALSLSNGNDCFIYAIYLFPVLALISIIGACLAIKHIKASRIMLTIPLVCFVLTSIYTFAVELFSVAYLLGVIGIFTLGFVATLLAY